MNGADRNRAHAGSAYVDCEGFRLWRPPCRQRERLPYRGLMEARRQRVCWSSYVEMVRQEVGWSRRHVESPRVDARSRGEVHPGRRSELRRPSASGVFVPAALSNVIGVSATQCGKVSELWRESGSHEKGGELLGTPSKCALWKGDAGGVVAVLYRSCTSGSTHSEACVESRCSGVFGCPRSAGYYPRATKDTAAPRLDARLTVGSSRAALRRAAVRLMISLAAASSFRWASGTSAKPRGCSRDRTTGGPPSGESRERKCRKMENEKQGGDATTAA
eukprot:923113-Pleurochrysis_carterae.AAC.3